MLFTGRQHVQSPVLAMVEMSICLSVGLSHAGTVSK